MQALWKRKQKLKEPCLPRLSSTIKWRRHLARTVFICFCWFTQLNDWFQSLDLNTCIYSVISTIRRPFFSLALQSVSPLTLDKLFNLRGPPCPHVRKWGDGTNDFHCLFPNSKDVHLLKCLTIGHKMEKC